MTTLNGSSATSKASSNESLFKILVASDIHLGYKEKHQILSDDSFIAFEEILQIANSRDVDFILLGGDLFHDAMPSPNSLNRCILLLRTYVMGDKMIEFEFLSDQNQNFEGSFNHKVNYEDLNLNVAIPVFSIHGNHDDMSGTGRLSALDLLSSAGFLNYIGKWLDLSQVTIAPVVLQKNSTKLALYGLSHIHDARLVRLFRDRKITIVKPEFDEDEVFNLMVLHQNRADRGRLNYLPEDKLPHFMDLIIWGHEHDCRIQPEQNGKMFVSQPGSSVATSLCEGEAIEKKVGILHVNEKSFNMEPVSLKTVRPFIFRSINIEEFVEELHLNERNIKENVEKFYAQQIEEMIDESKKKITGHPKQPTLPLIRLRIVYLDENHLINCARFGQKYEKRIANPESALHFKKIVVRTKQSGYNPDDIKMQSAFDKKKQQDCVEDVVESYFNDSENAKEAFQEAVIENSRQKPTSVPNVQLIDEDDDSKLKTTTSSTSSTRGRSARGRGRGTSSTALNVRTVRGKADQSLSAALKQRSTKSIVNKSIYIDDSDSD
ncbi:CLUMA_CG003472, isoform A [Clunio marinus]|uniref:CLUMA_CG003472, isoform A n=1 Tax=Clunio marinus TaxID=568069 RepID=A0A1J1HP34_9DIPT|nr:CLUMA_CG003472, isoform A [Clunio marinus]